MGKPRTIFDKIWTRHVITERDDGDTLLYIDRLLTQENSYHAFDKLRREARTLRNPDQVFSFADHYVPTVARDQGIEGIQNPEIRHMVETIEADTKQFGITLFGLGDVRQGILHIVGPEQGITQPGLVIAGADSHTSTHGALGAFAFGVGVSDVTHVLATQSLWRRRPRTMRVAIEGKLPFGVTAKDAILAVIRKIGADGAVGHVIEYAGSTIRAMSIEGRMTVCNMSIEAGARAGLVAADEATFAYIKGRPYAPTGADWERAIAYWRTLTTDEGAAFDRDVHLDACEIAPMVTWGTSPEDVVPVTGVVPTPNQAPDPERRARMDRALAYMGLAPGTPLTQIPVDRVFIGSCTNGRIEDLRMVARLVKGRKTAVPAMIVPGSGLVKQQAEAEGLDRIFADAGFEWRDAGCSMCVAINGDMLQPGERCASTSNRNFEGRQGRGGRTHLMSPSMAAAAAVTGHLTDVRQLGEGG
ncbi:MAG: 3-isopropylmalate dehydratase large subunit [Gammaproteobacteria bacterium]|nr:3-isopropylmalate dehydratase large subunit [Gammaproteobacteria bacterium]